MIERIRNTLLRRVAIVTYLPFMVTGMTAIALVKWAHDVMLTTVDGIHATIPEIRDCWQLIRCTWRGPPPLPPCRSGCTCPPGTTCYERCGE